MSKKSLNELFSQIRHANLKEDFEVGQAAQALHELKKSAKAYFDFLETEFTAAYKEMLNRPERAEEISTELSNRLSAEAEKVKSVADEVNSFIWDFDNYENPNSINRGKHREPRKNRWSRWEHRAPRHVQMKDREVDDN